MGRKRKDLFAEVDEARAYLEREQYGWEQTHADLDRVAGIDSAEAEKRAELATKRFAENDPQLAREGKPIPAGDVSYIREAIMARVKSETLGEFVDVVTERALKGQYEWARLLLRMLTWLAPTPNTSALDSPRGVQIVIENYAGDGKQDRTVTLI